MTRSLVITISLIFTLLVGCSTPAHNHCVELQESFKSEALLRCNLDTTSYELFEVLLDAAFPCDKVIGISDPSSFEKECIEPIKELACDDLKVLQNIPPGCQSFIFY